MVKQLTHPGQKSYRSAGRLALMFLGCVQKLIDALEVP